MIATVKLMCTLKKTHPLLIKLFVVLGCWLTPSLLLANQDDSSDKAIEKIIPVLISLTSPEALDETSPPEVPSPFGLNPELEPWENFDLDDWALDTPADFTTRSVTSRPYSVENGSIAPDGLSDRTQDFDFVANTLAPGSTPYFYTGSDGGMVFKSTIEGYRTSTNTNFVRSELREMLRRGDRSIRTQGSNANNWVLGYQPSTLDNIDIGGRNGKLTATLRVNQVTSTGDAGQVGRVIIGQIHASDDEPIRLYYRKLPSNELGGIYFAHELHETLGDTDDILVDMIGSNGRSAPNPENGIALGELFSYEIINQGADLEVVIRRGDHDGEIIASTIFDMSESGYDNLEADEWMYFKAGAYTQNNTGDDDDFDMVTFYRLVNTHD